MGVRVPLKICYRGRCIIVSALLNSSYEAVEEEIALPVDIARELGLWPMDEVSIEEADTAGGSIEVANGEIPTKNTGGTKNDK